MSSVERTMGLCEDFIKAKLNVKWDCNGRLNYAKPELLKLMKKGWCVINYGLRRWMTKYLKNMKRADNKQIINGIKLHYKPG